LFDVVNILKLFSFLVILTNLFFFNIKAKSFGVACVTAKYFNDDSEKKKESKPEKLSGLSIITLNGLMVYGKIDI